jgi:hypothetical protein
LGAGADSTFAPNDDPPWILPIVLAVRLIADYQELEQDSDHTIQAQILDPSMQEIHRHLERIRVFARGSQHYEGWRGVGVFAVPIQCEIHELGTYTATVKLDDGPSLTTPYEVRAAGDFLV